MIVIIDYGMGNLGSVFNMLKKIGASAIISSDRSDIEKAEKLILPGVGAFDAGMKNLEALGLIPLLNFRVLEQKTPILGVCLGMQLLCKGSEEGQLPGLGWLDAEAVRFKLDNNDKLKIPHMGWNTITVCQPHPLFVGLEAECRFYFVHSYHIRCANRRDELAQTNYGYDFTSAVVNGNIIGVQFHPEKSHKFGMRLYKNYAEQV